MVRSSSSLLIAGASAFAVLLSVASGCSSSTTPTAALTADTFLKSYDQAFCAFMVRCGQVPDTASCTTTIAPDATMAQGVAAVVFGSLKFDPTAGQACLDAMKTATCLTPIAGGTLQKDLATKCAAAFTSKGAAGAACLADIECSSGGCTPDKGCTGACCPGTCSATPPTVADGQSCIDPMTMAVLPCVAGDYCNMTDKKCEMQAQGNATCTVDGSCVDGYACDTGMKLCFKQSATGGTCNPSLKNPCLSIDEYCDAMKMVCTKLPQPGQPCVEDGVHNNACADDAACVTMMCQKLPGAGDMCTGNGPCLGELACNKNSAMCGPLQETQTCVDD